MADPKGILFFLDDLDAMELLSDEEKGRLFTALLKYARGDEDLSLSGNEKFLFPSFRSRIDRDRKKYQEKCEKNRENARKRSHSDGANDSDCKRTQATANDGSDGKRTQPIIKEKEEEEKSKDKNKNKNKNKKEEESISLSNQDIGKGCGENPEPDTDSLYLGMYGNVVLTPYDYEKLNNSFPDCEAAINRLSIKLFKGASLNCSHSEFLFGYLTEKLVKGQKITDPASSDKKPEPEKKNRDMDFEDMRKVALAKLQKGNT